MTNAEAKDKLIKIYTRICFMGGEISCKNPLTYHHMKPKREHGPTNVENGALLCRLEHDMLHTIENYYPTKTRDINELLMEYKEIRDKAIIEYLKIQTAIIIETLDYEIQDNGKMYVLKKRC